MRDNAKHDETSYALCVPLGSHSGKGGPTSHSGGVPQIEERSACWSATDKRRASTTSALHSVASVHFDNSPFVKMGRTSVYSRAPRT